VCFYNIPPWSVAVWGSSWAPWPPCSLGNRRGFPVPGGGNEDEEKEMWILRMVKMYKTGCNYRYRVDHLLFLYFTQASSPVKCSILVKATLCQICRHLITTNWFHITVSQACPSNTAAVFGSSELAVQQQTPSRGPAPYGDMRGSL